MMRAASTPLPWLAGLLALYLLVPIAAFVFRLPEAGASLPDPRLFAALWTSIVTSCIAVAIICLLGVPLAYLLAHGRSRLSRFVDIAVQLPLALPPLISGILLIYIVGPYTALGRLFGGYLTESMAGIILAQVFVAAPFLIVSARSAFAAVDIALPAVAATLGHGHVSRFFRVSVPIALPGIQAGLLLSWLRAFGEFGATVILAYHPFSLPVYTFVQFSSSGLAGTLAPVAVVLAAAFVILMLSHLRPARRHHAVQRPAPTHPPALPAATLAFDLQARLQEFTLQATYAPQSRRLVLLGPSGSGKSFTLQLLAGLRELEQGEIRYGEQIISALSPEQRAIGYMPQSSGLLPDLNVWQQINFGIGADPGVASYWLERLHLNGLEQRYPDELSGGQQRRVALARALTRGPRILLLDEPFSALDTPVRDDLRRELRRLQREVGVTTVLVTHDPEEAALLADDVIVLDDGRVLQADTRTRVFSRPNSPQVARLLGIRNMGSGHVTGPRTIHSHGLEVQVMPHQLPLNTPVSWCLRPEHIRLQPDGPYVGVAIDIVDLGALYEVVMRLGDTLEVTVRTNQLDCLDIGSSCRLALPTEAISLWPTGTKPIGRLPPEA